jgi:hypothetical protein
MAPEQIRGIAIDHRADLYACGILMFELLTGVKPFVSEKDDPIEVCSMHLKKAPPTLKDVQPGIDLAILGAIVARALAKKPEERYTTAVEFSEALDVVPKRRMQTAPVAIVSPPVAASETGWSVPADAKSSMFPSDGAPTSEPVSGRGVPIAGAMPGGVDSGPVATPPSAPLNGPVPSAPPNAPLLREPPPGLPGPSRAARASAPSAAPHVASAPIAAPHVATSSAPTSAPSGPFNDADQRAERHAERPAFDGDQRTDCRAERTESRERPAIGGLPADFDLSRAIPPVSPTGANDKGLSPGFDLSLAIPQADTPILERSAPVSAPVVPPSDQPTMAMADVKSTVAFLGAPPAGPSPLAASDAPAVAEAVRLPAPPTPQLPLTTRQLRIIGGSVLGLVLLIAIIAGTCGGGGGKKQVVATPDAAVVTPATCRRSNHRRQVPPTSRSRVRSRCSRAVARTRRSIYCSRRGACSRRTRGSRTSRAGSTSSANGGRRA